MVIQNNGINNQPSPIGFFLGIAGMLVSLYYSIMFIVGSSTGVEIVVGVIFALMLDYGKIALSTEIFTALYLNRLLSAVIYAIIVVILYGLSILAATFMLTSHNNGTESNQADRKIETIQTAINAKRAELSNCPQGALTKCVNPRTKELSELQAQLNESQNLSGDVLEQKKTLETWEKLASATGATVGSLQLKLAMSRAILLEIIAPIFVSLYLSKRRSNGSLETTNETFSNRSLETTDNGLIEKKS
jgi:hypothetical protein